jgi:hypothetical protein
MRMTVLGQYAKGLAHYNPLEAAAVRRTALLDQWCKCLPLLVRQNPILGLTTYRLDKG